MRAKMSPSALRAGPSNRITRQGPRSGPQIEGVAVLQGGEHQQQTPAAAAAVVAAVLQGAQWSTFLPCMGFL